MINEAAHGIASRTKAFFGHPLMVVSSMLSSAASLAWAFVHPTELALTLFLSILAIALESVILFDAKGMN